MERCLQLNCLLLKEEKGREFMYKFVSYFIASIIVFISIFIAFILSISEPSIIKSIVSDFYMLLLIGFGFVIFTLFLMYRLNKKTHQLTIQIEKNKEDRTIIFVHTKKMGHTLSEELSEI
jgi:hypothetical protein